MWQLCSALYCLWMVMRLMTFTMPHWLPLLSRKVSNLWALTSLPSPPL